MLLSTKTESLPSRVRRMYSVDVERGVKQYGDDVREKTEVK